MRGEPVCPLCGSLLEWSIWGSGDSATGGAACLRSDAATRPLAERSQCDWTGTVRRAGRNVRIEKTITPNDVHVDVSGIVLRRSAPRVVAWAASPRAVGPDCEALGHTGPCWGETELEEVGRRIEWRCRAHRGLIYRPSDGAGGGQVVP